MSFIIYTDGAYNNKLNKGGIAAIIFKNGQYIHTIQQGFCNTTNQRMELTAVLSALQYIKNNYKIKEVEVYTDSTYIVDTINTKRLQKWEMLKWVNNKNEKVANKDLWQLFLSYSKCKLKFIWIKGHNDNKINEIVDKLAKQAINKTSGINEYVWLAQKESKKKIKIKIDINQNSLF